MKFIFIGAGPQRPKGSDVLYSGPVSHDALPYYLSASDVFVLPTKSEGMSNAVLEALACGLPVVTTSIPSNVEILGKNYSNFVGSNCTLQELSTAIERALSFKLEHNFFFTLSRRSNSILKLFNKLI